jgi:phosphatidylglycerol:prolipoprotein diacylglycerol transferase
MPDGIPIHIGAFSYTIHFYGIILMLGALMGSYLAAKEAKRHGHNPEIIWDMLIYLSAVVLGVVTGKIR